MAKSRNPSREERKRVQGEFAAQRKKGGYYTEHSYQRIASGATGPSAGPPKFTPKKGVSRKAADVAERQALADRVAGPGLSAAKADFRAAQDKYAAALDTKMQSPSAENAAAAEAAYSDMDRANKHFQHAKNRYEGLRRGQIEPGDATDAWLEGQAAAKRPGGGGGGDQPRDDRGRWV